MSIIKFLKERKLNNICMAIILVTMNIYLLSLNSFSGHLNDIVYLDIMIIILYLIFLIITYLKWKSNYEEIYNIMIKKRDIEETYINGGNVQDQILRYIINYKNDLYEKDLNSINENIVDMEEYIAKWVHEIKLPISCLNIILESIDDDMSNRIKTEVEKINFLVNSVLYGSRVTVASEDIFIREENIQEIVKESIKNNAFLLINNNIEIKFNNLDYKINTDKKWILYVLDQLINNSIKYLSSKSEKILNFSCIDKKEYVQLRIEDNGIGIKKEDISRVFDKGFTGSNGRNAIYKSTGMGLYFSKKVIDKLEHSIEVQSSQDNYTRFLINFYKISDYLKVTKM